MRGEAAHRGERTEGAAYRGGKPRTAEAAHRREEPRAAQEGRGPRRRAARRAGGPRTERAAHRGGCSPRRRAGHHGGRPRTAEGGRALQRPHTAEESRAPRGLLTAEESRAPRRRAAHRADATWGWRQRTRLHGTLPFCSALSPYLHLMLTVHTDLRKGRGDLLQKLNSIGHRVRGVSSPERQQSGSSCG